MSDLQKKYGPRGLVVLAVNAWDEDEGTVRRFVKSKHLTHTVLLMGERVFKTRYGGGGVPHAFLVDRKGVLSSSHPGFRPGDETELGKLIERLL